VAGGERCGKNVGADNSNIAPKPKLTTGEKTFCNKNCPYGCFNTFCQSELLNICFPGPMMVGYG